MFVPLTAHVRVDRVTTLPETSLFWHTALLPTVISLNVNLSVLSIVASDLIRMLKSVVPVPLAT